MESWTLRDDESGTSCLDGAVAKLQNLLEVLAGVDVQHREGELLGREGLRGEVQKHGGVFASREEEDGPFAFCHDFAQDEEGVGLENVEMVGGVGGRQCRWS